MTAMVLEARDLRVSYGGRLILRDTSLSVKRGELVGLIGPNGSGKTTLVKAMTGVVRSDSGTVLLDGSPLSQLSRKAIAKRVSVVPQEATLPPGFSVMDIVLMGRTAHLGFFSQDGPGDRSRAVDALESVGARDLKDRFVHQLSGGERQLVSIARGLAQDTGALLLDEPTAGLDLVHQIRVFEFLRRLASCKQLGVLVTVHDLVLASLYCDRLVLLDGGRVVAGGEPQHVLTQSIVAQTYGAEVLVLAPCELRGPLVLPVLQHSVSGHAPEDT